MKRKIDFCIHNLEQIDIETASRVMNSTFLTTGPMVDSFEKKFADYLQNRNAVGLTSCTAALHLALLRHGTIGTGDEVITTAMTFVATATAILQAGAKPVIVDVCHKSGLLLPETVEAAITARTRAIIPVHLYGRMADMKGFAKIAEKYDLVLIEDAAHCIEGERDGVRPGQLSAAACFSFYATKNITCGEGGAIVCNSDADAEWYRSARHHGISKNASLRYAQKYQHWDMETMGWKYNMDDIQAALLINQIDRIDSNHKRREFLEQLYRSKLAQIDGLEFIESVDSQEKSGHHLFTVLVPEKCNRDAVLEQLSGEGVGCAVNYRAIHTLQFFKETYNYKPEDFPVANRIGERTISLPLYPKLHEDDVAVVCMALKNILVHD